MKNKQDIPRAYMFDAELQSNPVFISDDIFRQSLDKALKAQGLTKKERNERIERYLCSPVCERDCILDVEETKAREAKKREDVPSEKAEQISFVNEFRKRYPGVDLFCVRNDGSRSFAERPEQILMGVLPGVSDLISLQFKMCIEMKRVKGSVHSEEQKAWQEYCDKIGFHYVLAFGCEDGLRKVGDIRGGYISELAAKLMQI